VAKLITPLAMNVPITDANGNPTPYFQRILEEISDARISASVIDAMGGDPGGDRVVVWDDSTGDLAFMTISEALDFITGASHGDILYRDSTGWETLQAGTAGQFLKTNGAGADPSWDTAVAAESRALVKKAANHTTANYSAFPNVTWDAEEYDTDNYHSTSSNTDRLTVPSAGTYMVYGQIHILAGTLTASDFVRLTMQRFNSSNVIQSLIGLPRNVATEVSAGPNMSVGGVSAPIVCNSGDYFILAFGTESDTSITVDASSSYFGIRKLA